MKRSAWVIFASAVIVFALSISVSASKKNDIPELEELIESLPEEFKEEIESSDGEDDVQRLGNAVMRMSSADRMLLEVLEAVGLQAESVLKLFLAICALLILSSVFRTASSSIDNDALSSAIRFCSAGALFATIVYTQYSHFARIEDFFESLGNIMNAMIPISATVWALGGNVGCASAGSASLYLILNVSEGLFGLSVIPVCSAMSVLGLCDAMSDEMRTGKILGAIKKIYGFFLGIVMTVLVSALAAQTSISAAADSTAARSARMMSGSFIPILGGSIGETLRTVSGGVAYLKNVFGFGGVFMILGTLMPVAVSLLLTRIVFLITAGLADILGCPSESRLLENLGETFGTMLAVCVSVSVMFVLSFCIFMQSVIAVA